MVTEAERLDVGGPPEPIRRPRLGWVDPKEGPLLSSPPAPHLIKRIEAAEVFRLALANRQELQQGVAVVPTGQSLLAPQTPISPKAR